MSIRYQHGYLRCIKRKNGNSSWEFMWRKEVNAYVARLGFWTIVDYTTQVLAQAAVNGLRMQFNEGRNRLPQQSLYVNDLIDHYLNTELAATWHSHATCIVYRKFWLGRSSHLGARSLLEMFALLQSRVG